jgi:hypothetical protein
LIFGPYSTEWRDIPSSIPKIYFSGENWHVPDDSTINLFITSSTLEDDKHIRIPTWMTFIDWFSGSKELPTNHEDNPIRIPLHFAMTSHPIPFDKRDDFCAFVVSNSICKFRNETFHAVNNYKHVNSGGHLYNNIGGPLELKYPGGGCGDISKHHFFAKHRFTISFENSQSSGYITEKVLHAKMAGCIPLYWGDKDTDNDFVKGSIVNLSQLSEPDKVVTVLKKLEEHPELCSTIASTPILDKEKKEKAEEYISRMSKRIIELLPINLNTGLTNNVSIEIKNKLPERIDKIYAVNLDTRPDRWQNLIINETNIMNFVERISAVNGKTLKINSFIYELFKNNDFNWKKSLNSINVQLFLRHFKILLKASL